MDHTTAGAGTSGLACEVCGRLPHPRKLRLTLAKLTSVLPLELLLHALVIHFHMSYVQTVTVLAITTTVLVIWVVEPSAMRLLKRWLHAPAIHARERLHGAESLWRVRVTLDDQLGSMEAITAELGFMEAITAELAALRATILDLQVHPFAGGARAEIVVGAAEHLREEDLLRAIQRGGGVDVHVWQTTALALVDGQTRALTLAARIAVTPEELPLAVAEMLDAKVVTDHRWLDQGRSHRGAGDGTTLRIPSLWSGLFVFSRPDEPFTAAEAARANGLAQIAEAALVARATPAAHPPAVRAQPRDRLIRHS
ncbi:MAG: amino acid-binding protein [Dermatophilaceae bacterium]